MINCKVKLKFKWAKYCVLSADGNEYQGDNDNNFNSNRIIFTIKDTNLYVPVVTLLAKGNQKLSKLFLKIRQMNLDIFLN